MSGKWLNASRKRLSGVDGFNGLFAARSLLTRSAQADGCSNPSASLGMLKKNVDPSPGLEVTQMRPPYRSTMFLQIAKPTPVPGYLSLV